MALTQETSKRVVHFFNFGLQFKGAPDNEQPFKDFFNQFALLSKSKDERRYQAIGGKLLFVQDVVFINHEKLIRGKLRAVRTDEVPELLNMDTDTTREIDRAEKEGIVETVHFVVSYRNRMKRIAIEYHLSGAKAHEFKSYLLRIGEIAGLEAVYMERIVNNNMLDEVERRMGRIGQIHMRVPKDNLGQLKKLEGNVASFFQQAQEFADTDAITLDLQFNAKRRVQTGKAEEILRTLTKNIRRNELAAEAFESLTVRMEDTEHNNAMEMFDLLSDKAKTRVTVNKKPSGNGLDSEDVFQKIADEMHRLKYL